MKDSSESIILSSKKPILIESYRDKEVYKNIFQDFLKKQYQTLVKK